MRLAPSFTACLLLDFLFASGCASVSVTTAMKETDAGPFTLSLPASLRQIPVNGIDSDIGRYEARGFKVSFDYGAYSNRLDYVPDPDQTRTNLVVDGRPCVLVSWREKGSLPSRTAIHFPVTARLDEGKGSLGEFTVREAHGLTLVISYARPELANVAQQICRSIQFDRQP